MHGQTHDIASLLEATAQTTGETFVLLTCENAGGSNRIGQAMPSLSVEQIDILSEGPLILLYADQATGQRVFDQLTIEARQGREDTGGLVEVTTTYVGRAFEGECSRTGVLRLDNESTMDPREVARFTGNGMLIKPPAGFRVAA